MHICQGEYVDEVALLADRAKINKYPGSGGAVRRAQRWLSAYIYHYTCYSRFRSAIPKRILDLMSSEVSETVRLFRTHGEHTIYARLSYA